jgi:CHAT domain-containing protein
VPLAPADELRKRLRLLRFQMRKFRLGSDYQQLAARSLEQATDTHLRELYCDLIAPLRDRLEGARHLIFAPHDYLHHLPFHALCGPNGYVIDEFTTSYAPSATVFALCAARQPGFAPQSLVLGLPDPLAPHIALEAANAAAVLPNSRLFLGEAATEAALRRFGPESRFIHIATHGLFRRDNPMFSAIRLGDSHLTLFDLYHLALSAELVTLSGCSTGLNVVVGGDELLGLMRGLLLAGAHSVMVSLWDVNDQSTAQFMKSFYEHVGDTGHKAMALQQAMREIRRQYPHPYFWAPFVLAGKYACDGPDPPPEGS